MYLETVHQKYTLGLSCTVATVTPDDVVRLVAAPALNQALNQAYMQVKLGTCLHQLDDFSLYIFRNASYEFTPFIQGHHIQRLFQQKILSLLTGSLIAEEDLLSKG